MAEKYFDTISCEDQPSVQVIDLSELLKKYYENELDMTSIGMLMLLEKSLNLIMSPSSETEYNAYDTDYSLHRLSLAHERMYSMPKILLKEVAPTVKILDISNNEFNQLDFLEEFTDLNSLICDHNNISADQCLPFLPKLELLWMNHCKILDLYHWIYKLSSSCPNLRFLSLMGNPGAPSYRVSNTDRVTYRLFIISLFPYLQHLDDKYVTEDERKMSQKLYRKHLVKVLATKAQQNMPNSVRKMSYRMSRMLSSSSESKNEGKNLIV